METRAPICLQVQAHGSHGQTDIYFDIREMETKTPRKYLGGVQAAEAFDHGADGYPR